MFSFLQLAAAAEIDEEPVSKAKQSRSEKKARKVTSDFPFSYLAILKCISLLASVVMYDAYLFERNVGEQYYADHNHSSY